MTIVCPYCGKHMTLKGAKPGRYKPKCSKCSKIFLLGIPKGDDPEPIVKKLQSSTNTKPASPKSVPSKQPVKRKAGASAPTKVANQTAPVIEQTIAVANPGASGTVVAQPQRAVPNPSDQTIAASAPTAIDATIAVSPVATGGQTSPGVHDATQLVSTRALPGAAPTGAAAGPLAIGQTLSGYKILRELGHGAMGSVYLAQQLSLDRSVAMKVIQPEYAKDPVFIARFTREAYAAAQLTHHNVIQIYDLGSDGDVNFFSMEFVNGQSLAEMVAQHGKLDVEAAVGFVLQAARGLQFAHNQGMVHRDIKPGNLMVNQEGIVKVADLGLVKTPQMAQALDETGASESPSTQQLLAASTADVTNLFVAMGTPAYMSPEQAENAAGVDHRADIYSLGCTLYVLLTGQPPYQGTTAVEVITKHKTEPMVRPDVIVKRVPKTLSDIIMKMVAKAPEERYANLGEVIEDLENFLGVTSSGPFSPTEEHAQTLEQCVNQFNGAALGKIRSLAALAFFAGVAVLALVSLLFSFSFSAGFLVAGIVATLTYFIVSGLRDRTYLFDKARELVWSSRITDWLMWLGGGLLFLMVSYLLGIIWVLLAMAIVGAGCGAAFHFVLDRGLTAQRAASLKTVEDMLRSLRLRGVEEEALRQFVAKYSGKNWEEFFEALFGFEEKITAREHLTRTEQGRRNRKFRGWREPIIKWIDERVNVHREAKSRKHLQKVEAANLQAQGMSAALAKQNASLMADAVMDEAADARIQATQPIPTGVDPKVAAAEKRARIKAMLADARSGKYSSKRRGKLALLTGPLGFAFGGKMRFLLGCLLVVGCMMWISKNKLTQKVSQAAEQAVAGETVKAVDLDSQEGRKPLNWPLIGRFFDSFNPGVAGVVLLFLALFRGWKMSIFALPAAGIMCLGPTFGMPGLEAVGGSHTTSLVIGLAVAVVGVFFGRTRSD